MAVMYDDENISSTASSKWAIVTRPGESGFWQENSQISEARLQMSRQRRASPESAATYKKEHFRYVYHFNPGEKPADFGFC